MDDIFIAGQKPLHGSIAIQGSKNAVLPMMAACLLHRGVSVLKGCPRIADVFCMEEILKALGAVTWWEDHDLYMDCRAADKTEIPARYSGKMRSSVIVLGALLARNGQARIGYPGGCVIGKRPIDMHLFALKCLGARIQEEKQEIFAWADGLTGCEIHFKGTSVGATEQAILAAVTAKGKTRLTGCAREPEITWLCACLKGMGARITGQGTDTIEIQGVEELSGADIQVPPDRIVAGTYICAAAVTRGEIEILNPPLEELDAFLKVYRKIGGQYEGKSGKLLISGRNVGRPIELLETEVYPGFPTDLQSPFMAVLATIPGKSRIREMVFEDRFKAVSQFCKMGACISVDKAEAVIEGGRPLYGCTVCAQELRGGAALILAGLACKGVTCVKGYSFVKRGYEHICEDLRALGGRVYNEETRGT